MAPTPASDLLIGRWVVEDYRVRRDRWAKLPTSRDSIPIYIARRLLKSGKPSRVAGACRDFNAEQLRRMNSLGNAQIVSVGFSIAG